MINEVFATIFLAALPLGELRVAIPFAVHEFSFPIMTAFALSVIGNLLPFFPLYFGLDAVRRLFENRIPWLTRFIDAQIDRSRRRVEKRYVQYGAFALFLFTALPLPLTGLWTATLASVALKIPVRYALYGIVPGVITAGIIVSLLTAGAYEIF